MEDRGEGKALRTGEGRELNITEGAASNPPPAFLPFFPSPTYSLAVVIGQAIDGCPQVSCLTSSTSV